MRSKPSILVRCLLTISIAAISGCETQYTRDVSGVYVSVDSLPRNDTVVLWTNINPDSEGFFFRRFRDRSDQIHTDSGNFLHLCTWNDTPDHLGYLYGVEVSRWIQADDSVRGPIEAMISKHPKGQLLFSLGTVQDSGHNAVGNIEKFGPSSTNRYRGFAFGRFESERQPTGHSHVAQKE